MTQLPAPHVTIQRLIDSAHEAKRERQRPHLGCSEAGHPCERWLWLKFRWAVIEGPETFAYGESIKSKPGAFESYGQLLRLFERGHYEEPKIHKWLSMIGVTVENTQGRVQFSHHVSGSIDGECIGVPGAEKTRHLLECKTSGLNAFKKLRKEGCEEAKPLHWVQQHLYMLGSHKRETWVCESEPPKLKRSLYFTVCKDNDALHTERVRFDRDLAEFYRDRAIRITLTEHLPEPMSSASRDWYECKMCPGHSFCYEKRLTREVNCRTCAHSTPVDDGWHCAKWDSLIPLDAQYKGCDWHVLHPDLVPREAESIGEQWAIAYGEHVNGNPEHLPGAKLSRELVDIWSKEG